MDTKVGQMKRELEEVANKAHDLQMTELKRMKFSRSEPPSFKKKGHEVQYKHNERVKLCITEAEDAIKDWKLDKCVEKLNEGKEQIESDKSLFLLQTNPNTGGKPSQNMSTRNWPTTRRMQKRSRRQKKRLKESLTRQETRRKLAQAVVVDFPGRDEDLSMADKSGYPRLWRPLISHRYQIIPTTTSIAAQSAKNQGSASPVEKLAIGAVNVV